jgi:hypothetical protein
MGGCECKALPREVNDCLDVEGVITQNVRTLRAGRARNVLFPEIRELFGPTRLIATFAHLTPNLPFDEVYGNYVLAQLAERAGLAPEEIINCAYDNYIPRKDTPKAFTVQFGIVNPKIMEPDIIPSLQTRLNYDRSVLCKDGQNRVRSAPEQKLEAFRSRFDQVDAIYQKYAGAGDVCEKLVGIRSEFFGLLGLDAIPEVPYSRALQSKTADVLEVLYRKNFPFWEMPVPEEKYWKDTFLVEGIDATQHRQHVRFEDGAFVFEYDQNTEKRIPKEKIFDALRHLQVIPTMPLVILSLVTAPQIPHLGGGVWKQYAPVHTDVQAEWLGIPERNDTLILGTGGFKLLSTYRRNEELIGFPTVYLTYGPDLIRGALREGWVMRVEFKRRVF